MVKIGKQYEYILGNSTELADEHVYRASKKIMSILFFFFFFFFFLFDSARTLSKLFDSSDLVRKGT